VTQDWHELNHVSFASNHKDGKPFVTIKLENGKNQELWPIHCVQESYGA
jgi:nicotinamidase/pyrazinamidase